MSLISTAYAQAASSAAPQQTLVQTILSFAPFVLIFGVFYFLMIRPQLAKQKQQRATVAALKRGDRVSVNGILGTITKVREDTNEAEVEIAPQLRINVIRDSLVPVATPKTAVANDK